MALPLRQNFANIKEQQGKEPPRKGKAFRDENSRLGVNDRGEISLCTLHDTARNSVSRLIDAVPRNDAAGSVTAFATYNTVGNSPLPAGLPCCCSANMCAAPRCENVATSSKKTFRYRKRRVTFTGAPAFLENTFLPRRASAREADANVNGAIDMSASIADFSEFSPAWFFTMR